MKKFNSSPYPFHPHSEWQMTEEQSSGQSGKLTVTARLYSPLAIGHFHPEVLHCAERGQCFGWTERSPEIGEHKPAPCNLLPEI